ncbi:MAG: hypothetical protein N2110_04050 [Flavobacteriales bacterium]|nr:hypothetical protein [Flavobacteriales bacterium]
MKYSVFFVTLAFMALGISSCKKKSQETSTATSLDGIFEFKANGVHYTLNGAVYARVNMSSAPNSIMFAAENTDISLVVAGSLGNYTGPGVYELTGSDFLTFSGINGKTYYITSPVSPLAPFSHGQITVSSDRLENNIRYTQGTFLGVAYASENDSLVITEGKFRDMDY